MQTGETRIEIPDHVEWILKKLNKNGFEAFAVGGCVRDTLLGRVPEDWDITTSAKPGQVKAIFGRTIDTGLLHGTVTVMRDGIGYEVTTYRVDGEYEDGRHPKSVEFTADLREDLRRRDFTINAMAYSHQTGIVDVFGGREDLEYGVIRCVGNAMERFTEDALRILRAIRFSAQLGFEIEKETYLAISEIAPNLVHVSKERIQAEITKLLVSGHPEKILLVYETGISPYISPAFHQILEDRLPLLRMEEFQRFLAERQPSPKKPLRYAAFLRLTSEERAVMVMRDLKMDNDTISRVRTLVHWLPVLLKEDKPKLRRILSQMSDELFDDLLELKRAVFKEEIPYLKVISEIRDEIRESGDCIRLKDLAVSGNDLIAAGIQPGREIGRILNELFEAVLEQPELNDRARLIEMAATKIS